MGLESAQADGPAIESESDFFQRLKRRTAGVIGLERVEPANESGFPDVYFVLKSPKWKKQEGTVELKFKDSEGIPDLTSQLTRGNQKAALIEYYQMGGRRRFFLVYNRGDVWLYDTEAAYNAILGKSTQATALGRLEEPAFCHWLASCLEK